MLPEIAKNPHRINHEFIALAFNAVMGTRLCCGFGPGDVNAKGVGNGTEIGGQMDDIAGIGRRCSGVRVWRRRAFDGGDHGLRDQRLALSWRPIRHSSALQPADPITIELARLKQNYPSTICRTVMQSSVCFVQGGIR